MLKKWILIFSLVLALSLIWAQGSEDFTNSAATTSYADGSFVGNGGVTWTYGHSRDQETYPIDGNGLMLRRASDSYLSAIIPGGVGNFSFQYRKAYTGGSPRQLEVYVNDVLTGTTDAFGGATGAETNVYTYTVSDINETGNVTIKIKNVGATSTNRQTTLDNIIWTGYTSGATPTIYATGTFTDFSTFTGVPSASQSYSLSGAALTGNISITAPAGFQVSTDNAAFAQTKSVPSTFNGPIYVRLSGASAGTFNGNIAHTSTGAVAVDLPVSGTVQAPTPTISLSGSLNAFTTAPGTPSAAQHYSVSGVYLTTNIAISAPAGFELSLTQTGIYTATLQLNQVSGTVAPTDVYVRLTGAALGTFSGDISHISGSVTQNMPVNGNVATDPHAEILLRPAQISLADPTHESAVLVKVENYLSDDARYRLYNGSNQYNPWNVATSDWSNTTSYSAGPNIPGTPSSSVSWWIPFQRGNNNSTVGSYRDRLGTGYTANYQTAALPAATAIVTGVPILKSQVNFNTWNDFTAKHVVLAYDAANTLISAASTGLTDGAFTVWVESGTAITRIEVRDVMNNLLESVTGTWPQVLNPQILVTGTIDPLYNTAGLPSEEIGEYSLVGQDLTENINVTAPEHFEIASAIAGPFSSSLSLLPNFSGTIYVRIDSEVLGVHGGFIVHSSVGAEDASMRVDGETLAPSGVITVTSSMTDFYQELGTPSASQSYSFSSTGLSSTVAITAGAPYEISQNGSTGWAANLNVASSYSGLIYVRLNAAEVGTYNGVEIEHSHANASPVIITVSGTVGVPIGPVENLFFSEYIEGLSNNKALEIFNASGSAVDLSRYKVELYANGVSAPGTTLALTGILAAGDVYVIANAAAAAEIQDVADITSNITFFNGDDALALRCINPPTLMDVFGTIGTDPGTGWAVAGVANATVDHTLIRKSTVAQGNTDWAAQAGTDVNDSEWIVMPVGHHTDLGTHTFNPGGNVAAAPSFDPPAGTYLTAINVTLSSTTPGATIRYTTDGSDPSSTLGTIYSTPIAVSASTTIKAIAYATGYDPSFISAAVYAMPAPISTIAQLRTQPTGTSHVYTLTGEAVLTYMNVNRNLKYIQDATAAIVIDDYSGNITTNYNLYDGITGITGTLNVYSNLMQFVPVADPGAATSTNNVVMPEVRTLLSLTEADQGKLIEVQGATITHATYIDFPATAQNLDVSDATASLTLRTFVGTDYANTPIPADAVNLTCLVGQFGTTMQVSPRFLSDIQAAGGTLGTPVVTIVRNGNNVDLSWTAITGASSYRIESSDDPYGTFTQVGSPTANTTISIPATPAMKFFKVIAIQ